jgi:hypothetical protein
MAFPVPALDPIVGHATAGAMALVFLVGATQKIRARDSFRGAVDAYRLLPETLVGPFAVALPALEAIAAIALLIVPYRSAGAALALALLLGVTGAVVVNLTRGRTHIDCGCGGPEGEQRLSWGLVARNAVLMAAVALSFPRTNDRALDDLDYATALLAALALYLVYAIASQLLANRPRLAALKAH